MSAELGDRIRALRQLRGRTRLEVARAADVTRIWLSRLERGQIADPAPAALARVAEVLAVPLAELLTGRPTPSAAAQASAGSAAANLAIIRDLVTEVVNRGDLAVADSLLAPTYTIHGPFPDVTVDRDQLKRAVTRLRRAFPDVTVAFDDMVATEDKVVVRWTLTGTHQGTVAGVPPTGAALVHAGIAIFRLAEGRVVESWMLADATDQALLRRLGFAPAPRPQQAPPAADPSSPAGPAC